MKKIIKDDGYGKLLVYPPEKFPVKTENEEYKVSVGSKYTGLGGYDLVCSVFIENKNRTLFNPRKFKRVTKCSVWDVDEYKEWVENLVGFATTVVKRYEERNRKSIEHYKAVEKSLKEFEEWDGVVGD